MAEAARVPNAQAADLVVACLENLGVEYVFGVPGGAIEPLYSALARSGRRGGPQAVAARHEAGAAFMADGYARETGRIGVCIATSGPGATNLITGVACAYDNGIPMLVITGQPPIHSFGKNALQESGDAGARRPRGHAAHPAQPGLARAAGDRRFSQRLGHRQGTLPGRRGGCVHRQADRPRQPAAAGGRAARVAVAVG
jgi:hypothetical protein